MTIEEQFKRMRLLRRRVVVGASGELIAMETRKSDLTGLVLTRTAPLAPSESYLAAVAPRNRLTPTAAR